MPNQDAGQVKAEVVITYDGSGIDKAKSDLQDLAEVAGNVGGNVEEASKNLSDLNSQMAENTAQTSDLASEMGNLEKPVTSGEKAVTGLTEVLQEHQNVAEETAATHEDMQAAIETTAEVYQKAAPAVQQFTERTQHLDNSLSGMQERLSSSSEAWVQYTSAMQESIQAMAPGTYSSFYEPGLTPSGVDEAMRAFNIPPETVDNLRVFQDALASSDPFTMIYSHLDETGQSIDHFTQTIGESNAELYHQMSTDWAQTSGWIDNAGTSFEAAGNKASTGFSAITSSANDADKAVAEFLGKPVKAAEGAGGGLGEILGGALSDLGNTVMGVSNWVMPLMAFQMAGMAIQAVGQAIYDSAAIAEGPAAHQLGSFTGTIDAIGQAAQRSSAQFSEAFGQGIMPTLNAINDQMNQPGGMGGIAGGLGGTVSFLADAGLIIGGFASLSVPGASDLGMAMIKAGGEGLINQGAAWVGLPQPFQGPGPQEAYQQQFAQLPQTIRTQTSQTMIQADTLLGDAGNPDYLQSQDELQAAQIAYQRAQRIYNSKHYISPQQALMDYQAKQYDVQQEAAYQQATSAGPDWSAGGIGAALGGAYGPTGDLLSTLPAIGITRAIMGGGGPYRGITDAISSFFGGSSIGNILSAPFNPLAAISTASAGLNSVLGGGNFMGNIFGGIGQGLSSAWNWLTNPSPSPAPPPAASGGCFVAGTLVLMADSTEKAIETLQVDEQVQSHDGPTPILAFIVPPPKRVYKLTLDNGCTLILTNSHPISTVSGWKAISSEAAKAENPDLSITPLQIRDSVHTASGIHVLTSILPLQEVRQVYNVTVAEPHTFYANGVLVHNKVMSAGGEGTEQVSLSHTFTADITWAANNLEKSFTGQASWVGQGLANTFNGVASWVGSGLANTFNGVASWVGQGLENTFSGVASWIGQGLTNTFNGVASWVGQGLANTFNGVASWVGEGLENLFTGKAKWEGQDLEHLFTATASWTAQNLNPNFMINPSFTMLAEGTSNWPGGPAVVGEAGTELVEHNGQYSLFDQGAALINLPSGANVYPMRDLTGSPVAQFADGTGGPTIPIMLGMSGSGGGTPQAINVIVQFDSATILQALGIPLAQTIRVSNAGRSY